SVVSGAADGQVATWDPVNNEAAVLGSHGGPVRGILILASGLVISWGHTVRFWLPWLAHPPIGRAEGFPGGVRSLVAGEQTYTVLCGDGSVRRRLLPDRAVTEQRDRPERGCLAVAGDSVYFGLGSALCQLSPNGQVESVVVDN